MTRIPAPAQDGDTAWEFRRWHWPLRPTGAGGRPQAAIPRRAAQRPGLSRLELTTHAHPHAGERPGPEGGASDRFHRRTDLAQRLDNAVGDGVSDFCFHQSGAEAAPMALQSRASEEQRADRATTQ